MEMKKIDVKEHTKKYLSFSANARHGNYPNAKLAKRGALVGLSFGGALTTLGVYAVYNRLDYGIFMCLFGLAALVSNSVVYRKNN
ncbi:hypothetical protein [Exiguobacterium sp. s162]|uniref:hypothetical protein n=1 Tax=Exiguobacterium sp. s162 TaxID=2751276 RepID=UPI001BECCD59|nr:hypothetical protein [Exiguobacterium sp. s162]